MERPQWRTAIGDPQDANVYIRGYDLDDLARNLSFAGMIYLTLTGELPTRGQERVIDTLLISVVDHGISPSSTVARYLASAGVPLQVSIGGAVLSVGDVYGGACEELAQLLQEGVASGEAPDDVAETLVTDYLKRGRRLPGYGHPQHLDGDPRVRAVFDVSGEAGVLAQHTELALAIAESLERQKGRPLPINNDGGIAATVSDLGLPWQVTRAFVIIPRTLGLTAHVLEEQQREPGWRHVPLDEVTYDGPSPRPFPEGR